MVLIVKCVFIYENGLLSQFFETQYITVFRRNIKECSDAINDSVQKQYITVFRRNIKQCSDAIYDSVQKQYTTVFRRNI